MKKLKPASSIKVATIIEMDIPVDSYAYQCLLRIMAESAQIEYQNRCIKALIDDDTRELLKLYQ